MQVGLMRYGGSRFSPMLLLGALPKQLDLRTYRSGSLVRCKLRTSTAVPQESQSLSRESPYVCEMA